MKKPRPLQGPFPFSKTLLRWYDAHRRDLPWRGIRNPYATFVSEMMLQQTQVKTVIPYYLRFLKELPDWGALASAKEEKVLKLWEGLGYYRRARNLQAAAQRVVRDHGGKLPNDLEAILGLPGVGPYSAGAILSIAYQKQLPLVDGNVIRVFSRHFLLRGDLKNGPGHRKVWDLARDLVPKDRPGDHNQALMELGATLCLPEDPQCLICPLLASCEGAKKGVQRDLPERSAPSPVREVFMAALFLSRKGRFLVRRRPQDEKWLKGLWEFPSVEGKDMESARKALEKKWRAKTAPLALHQVRHQITHHRIHLSLFTGTADKTPGKDVQWVTKAQLTALPFSSAQAKLRQRMLERTGD